MTRVRLPTHLRSYTAGEAEVLVAGTTLREVLDHLEARYPGLRVRMIDEQDRVRPHVKLYLGVDQVRDLDTRIEDREVHILAALSGG